MRSVRWSKRAPTMVPPGSTTIVTAALGNDAGAIGAATMAFRGGLDAV